MKQNNFSISKFSNGLGIDFELIDAKPNSNILIFGNIENFFGEFMCVSGNNYIRSLFSKSPAARNYKWFINALHNGSSITVIEIVEDINEISYYNKIKINLKNNYDNDLENQFTNIKVVNNSTNIYNEFVNLTKNMPKFDYIIQNPPYKGSLHLDFLQKGYELLNDTGKMVIVEPATWLIDLRDNMRNKELYQNLKVTLNKHVFKVIIENFNKEFNINDYVPHVITYIDKANVYNKIEFYNFGYKTNVDSLYDCNLIGNYTLIKSILNKIKNKHNDMMQNHIITKNNQIGFKGAFYTRYAYIRTVNGPDSDVDYQLLSSGSYYNYITMAMHKSNIITDKVPKIQKNKQGKEDWSTFTWLYGNKDELENWQYYLYNNKLPLFLCILVTFERHNHVRILIPWLVDKQYTDVEINNLFDFSKDEINLINKTIKKFERYSPWFKRYMCGISSVSNEEVQTFINSL